MIHFSQDRVSLGVYRPSSAAVENSPSEQALLEDLAGILTAGGSETTIVHEIQRVKFVKNIWNSVLGTATALTRYSLRAFFRPPHLAPGAAPDITSEDSSASKLPHTQTASQRATASIPHASPEIGAFTIPFLHDALTEVHTLGMRLYPPSPSGAVPGIDPDFVKNNLVRTASLHARPDSTHRASMLVDVETGRPMEVHHVVGEVVRMGKEAGFDMPVSTVFRCV